MSASAKIVDGRLVISMVKRQDDGEYECFANGESSKVSLTVTSSVEDPIKSDENEINLDVPINTVKPELKINEDKFEEVKLVEPKINSANSSIFKAKKEHGCLPNEFACKNGECINQTLMCDGVFDCQDASDEETCSRLFIYNFSSWKCFNY